MPSLTTFLAAAAILLLFVPTATFLFLVYLAKHAPMRVQKLRIAGDEALSDTFRRLAEPIAAVLEGSGWIRGSAILGTPVQEREGPTEGWLFQRPGEKTHAYLGWARGGFAAPATRFLTPFRGGITLATTSGHPLHDLSGHGRLGIERIDTRNPDELFARHRERVVDAMSKGLVAEDLDADGICERIRIDQIRNANLMISQGKARSGSGECIRLGWRFAASHAMRMVARRKEILKTELAAGLSLQERAALRRRDSSPSSSSPGARPEAPNGGKNRTLSWISLAVFAVAMGFWVGWEALPALLAVLLLHEGGHVLAMRLFKYRDVNVFFIPFLGALATGNGKPWGLAPWKNAIVSLAGPLPGIVLATVLAGAGISRPDLFPSYAWVATGMLLLLNLFNLLPLGGLDGGQFLQSVLFTRYPRMEMVFRAVGSLLLALFGLKSGMPMLAAFAALPLLGIPAQWDAAKLRVALARRSAVEGPPTDLEEATRRLEEMMGSEPFAKIPTARKGAVRQIVVSDLNPVPMPVWQSVCFAVLYLLLWAPVALVFLGWAAMRGAGIPGGR